MCFIFLLLVFNQEPSSSARVSARHRRKTDQVPSLLQEDRLGETREQRDTSTIQTSSGKQKIIISSWLDIIVQCHVCSEREREREM